MSKTVRNILIFTSLVAIAGVVIHQFVWPEIYWQFKTDQLQARDIDREVADAIKSKDYRLASFFTDGRNLPGVLDQVPISVINRLGFRNVAATGCVVYCDAQIKYHRAAEDYTRSYNTKLIRHLKQQGLIEGL